MPEAKVFTSTMPEENNRGIIQYLSMTVNDPEANVALMKRSLDDYLVALQKFVSAHGWDGPKTDEEYQATVEAEALFEYDRSYGSVRLRGRFNYEAHNWGKTRFAVEDIIDDTRRYLDHKKILRNAPNAVCVIEHAGVN